ncbi:MAG TPA: twin-arginine translocation signal domain-containing protein [Candidatus Paceibacterota bacterium]|nr:twin-arginine translocation signal domain-containing protein [Candidatus Paceibacterota bacterium]
MEKEISRRGFLKEFGIGAGAGLSALVLNSCATLNNKVNNAQEMTEKQRKAYKEYRQKYGRLDESNLTAEQIKCLKAFNDYARTEGLSEHDIKWASENYPFIKLDNLEIKDKVFLMERAYEIFDSIVFF